MGSRESNKVLLDALDGDRNTLLELGNSLGYAFIESHSSVPAKQEYIYNPSWESHCPLSHPRSTVKLICKEDSEELEAKVYVKNEP